MMGINVHALGIAGSLQTLQVGRIRKAQHGWVGLARIPTACLSA